MSFCMNKHRKITALFKIPHSNVLEMDKDVLKEMVTNTLSRILANEIVKDLEIHSNAEDVDTRGVIYESSIVVVRSLDYERIMEVVGKHDYRIMGIDECVVSLSELL